MTNKMFENCSATNDSGEIMCLLILIFLLILAVFVRFSLFLKITEKVFIDVPSSRRIIAMTL